MRNCFREGSKDAPLRPHPKRDTPYHDAPPAHLARNYLYPVVGNSAPCATIGCGSKFRVYIDLIEILGRPKQEFVTLLF